MTAGTFLAAAGLLLVAMVCAGQAGAESGGVRLLPVPAETILPGRVIAPADLTARRFQTTPRSLSGIAMDVAEITGKETRRRLMAGRPIPLSALSEPLAVRRGARLIASYEEAGLSISASVIALEDGAAGSIINARNIETGQIIRTEVLANGTLSVRAQ